MDNMGHVLLALVILAFVLTIANIFIRHSRRVSVSRPFLDLLGADDD